MVKLAEEVRVTEPAGTVPLTVSGRDCGELGALEVTTKLAEREPLAEGLATIWAEQKAPAFRDEPQVGLVMEKSELLVPEMAMEVREMEVLPVFCRVTVTGCEEVLTAVSGKLMEEGVISRLVVAAGGMRTMRKSDGAAVRVGWKGGVGGVRAKSAAVFCVGLLARLRSAAMVLVGAGLGEMVVRVKSWPQREPSPAAPPVELMQAETMSARVLSWAMGSV